MQSARLLLNVNVWVALFDDAHVASARANELIETPGIKIATCPLVENGVIRVLNLPGYGRRGAVDFTRVHGHNQITDLCLLALAVKHDGTLVTFDQNIPLQAVRGATAKHLRVL